jgi:alpha-N-acetylgalactosaminidase
MAIWAIMAAPLMMSNDLRNLRPEFKNILVNRDIIDIDQDALGIQGRQILPAAQGQGVEVWRRPVMPVSQIGNETWASFAVGKYGRRKYYASVQLASSKFKLICSCLIH